MLEKSTGEIIDRKAYNRSLSILLIITFSLGGIGSILLGVLSDIGVLGIFTGIGLLLFDGFSISHLFAKYEFKEEGVCVKYPFISSRMISWNEFQQVCICYANYKRLSEDFVVIACVKHGERKNLYGRWKTDNPFKHRKVITVDYTDELYEEIKKKCPYEVIDLRMTRSYRLQKTVY